MHCLFAHSISRYSVGDGRINYQAQTNQFNTLQSNIKRVLWHISHFLQVPFTILWTWLCLCSDIYTEQINNWSVWCLLNCLITCKHSMPIKQASFGKSISRYIERAILLRSLESEKESEHWTQNRKSPWQKWKREKKNTSHWHCTRVWESGSTHVRRGGKGERRRT